MCQVVGLVIETREPQELPCGRAGQDAGVDIPVPGSPERRTVVINLSICRYPALEEAAAALDWWFGDARRQGRVGHAAHQPLGWYALPSSIRISVFLI